MLGVFGSHGKNQQQIVGTFLYGNAGAPDFIGQARYGGIDFIADIESSAINVGADLKSDGNSQFAAGIRAGAGIRTAERDRPGGCLP